MWLRMMKFNCTSNDRGENVNNIIDLDCTSSDE